MDHAGVRKRFSDACGAKVVAREKCTPQATTGAACPQLRSWLPFRQHARAEGRVEASPRCWHHPGACRPAGRLVVDYKSASGPVTFLTPLEASACGVSRETSPLKPSG